MDERRHYQLASKDDMEQAFENALVRVLSNEELTKKFWARGYLELVSHAEGNASKWIGRRIFTSAVIAITTAGLVWLVKSGSIK